VLVVNKDYNNAMTGSLNLKLNSKIKRYDKSNDTVQHVADATSSIALNIPAGEAALYIIEPTNEPAEVLDSFELYLPNANTGYAIVDGLANAGFSLDSSNAKYGAYAGRIDYTYAPGGPVYTGITKNIAKDIAGYDKLQMWVKTSATANTDPFIFKVRLTDMNGGMWYGTATITSAAQNEYVLVSLPLNAFTNGAGTVHYNPANDPTLMTNVAISYIVDGFGENMTLWLDQMEFIAD
jgi:hypothetical protein